MTVIYYVFKEKIPTQEDLDKNDYINLEEFIDDNGSYGSGVITNDITNMYNLFTNAFYTNFSDTHAEFISKLKIDLNVTDEINPSLFDEDTSFKDISYIKLTTNRTKLKNYLNFILNLNEDYLNIYKHQINNTSDELPRIDEINHASNPNNYDVYINKNFHTTNGLQRCAIGVIDVDNEYVQYYDKNDFIDNVIWNYNKNDICTYYVHTQLCGEYNYNA